MTDRPLTPSAGPRATASAATVLTDRVLIQANCTDAVALADTMPNTVGGLVVTGTQALPALAKAGRAGGGRVLCADTAAETRWTAREEAPFDLGEPDLFTEPSLERSLDAQRDHGASLALTPTGHIVAGDSSALKATIHQANKLKRDDVVVRLPCDAAWATPAFAKQLTAVISRSEHPVALSLAHDQDPLERAGVAELLWDLAATQPHLILWRCDLAGLAHLTNGGLAAAVGFSATLRHGVRPGRTGFVNNVRDRTPYVLLPDWLRYMRGSRIESLFAATPAPRCNCVVCRGRPLDRFDVTEEDKFTAHSHNVAVLGQLTGALRQLDRAQRVSWWSRTAARGLQTHAEATAKTSVQINPPRALQAWSRVPVAG